MENRTDKTVQIIQGQNNRDVVTESEPFGSRCLIFEVRLRTLKAKKRGYSSAGRAPALQAGGHRFDPDYLHQHGLIAQPVRASA